MPNNFVDTSWVSMDILRLLVNKKQIAEAFNTDWESDYKQEFAVGAQIQIKLPQRFKIRYGLDFDPQGLDRLVTTVTMRDPYGIDFQWDDYEMAVKLERSEDELRKNYTSPAADQLAQELDSQCAQFSYQNLSNVVGTLGTDPTGVSTFYAARRRMKEKATPAGKRIMAVSSSMMATFGANITNFFQPGDELSRMFKEGYLGRMGGFDWMESNSLYSHTAGTWAGAVTVSGANQSGTSLVITATAADTFFVGDKFSIANVNAVNPSTRRIAGAANANNFTITQDLTAVGGAGADTINFLPAIYGPGSQYQNVDALPANGAALTLWPGTASPNGKVGTVGLALSEYAHCLVGSKLSSPKKVEVCQQEQDPQTKIALRFIRDFDAVHSLYVNRFDQMIGLGNYYQDNGGVCVAGA